MHSVPTYRNIAEKMLQNSENIITAASSLHDGPIAIELVFGPENSR